MAEPYDTLLQVQEHDTLLDQLRHRLEAMPERVALAGVRARQAALAAAVAEVQARVDDLAGRQAELEERIAMSATRRHTLEKRMRSGAVTASKDLQAMDHEVAQLADRERALEDEELVLMEEEEPLDAALAAHGVTAAELDVEAARLTDAVAEAEVELRAAIESESAERAQAATGPSQPGPPLDDSPPDRVAPVAPITVS